MAEEDPQPVDLFEVLEEAEETVEAWPAWQQRYDADIYGELKVPLPARRGEGQGEGRWLRKRCPSP